MNNMIKSVLAGFMIGMGSFIYLSVENKYIGAFLFALGLLTIISKGYNLYTGKIYDFRLKLHSIEEKCNMLLGNFIGGYFFAGGMIRAIGIRTDDLWSYKLDKGILEVFFLSVICGILMYLAVTLYKKEQNPLYVIMPIMVFILAGCEHCIANIFYWSLYTNPMDIRIPIYIIINILGNSIGSIIFYQLENRM